MLGFQKIMKKFDKNLTCKNGAEWLMTKFSGSELNSAEEIEKLIVKEGLHSSFQRFLIVDCNSRLRNYSLMSWKRVTGRKQ